MDDEYKEKLFDYMYKSLTNCRDKIKSAYQIQKYEFERISHMLSDHMYCVTLGYFSLIETQINTYNECLDLLKEEYLDIPKIQALLQRIQFLSELIVFDGEEIRKITNTEG